MIHPHRRHHGLARLAPLVAAGGLLLAAGCGSSGATVSGAPASPDTLSPVKSGTVKVSAVDNYFQDQDITVTAGSKVVWTNLGRNDHNIKTVDAGDFGVDTKGFGPGASYAATLSTPGTYHYYCTIHGTAERGMVGTIQVVAP